MKFLFRFLVLIIAVAVATVATFRFLVFLEMFDEYHYVTAENASENYQGLILDTTAINLAEDYDGDNLKAGLIVVYQLDDKQVLSEIVNHEDGQLVLYNGNLINHDQVIAILRIPTEITSDTTIVSFSYLINIVAENEFYIYGLIALAVLILIYGILLNSSVKSKKVEVVSNEDINEENELPVVEVMSVDQLTTPDNLQQVVTEKLPEDNMVSQQQIDDVIIAPASEIAYEPLIAEEIKTKTPEVVITINELTTPELLISIKRTSPETQVVVSEKAVPNPITTVDEASPITQIRAKPSNLREYSNIDKLYSEYMSDYDISIEPEFFGDDIGSLTYTKIVKYCEEKDDVIIRFAVGRKPTSFRINDGKSFMMLYRLDNLVKMVFKCAPVFGEELVKKSNGAIKVSNFPHGSVWFATEDITLVDNKMLKKLIDLAYHLALHDI